ncbi:signal peptidase I [Campylobacter lari]|nr:signal peptidase I [Campylobacter lari]EAK0794065.1 signal peptidase I [Campylobacter lari]EAK0800261.1 signal peptidase I [Campylobacter lari]EAL0061440.1 signal peptidase I [Campylobacter lari]
MTRQKLKNLCKKKDLVLLRLLKLWCLGKAMNKISNRAIRIFILGVIFFLIGSFCIKYLGKDYGFGIVKSKSISEYIVIYKRDISKEKSFKDKIVYFVFPKDTPYYKKNEKFAKYVRCEEGDVLTTSFLNYYCNGKFLGSALTTDSKNNKVENFVFNGVVPENKYFVLGTHPRSYDSRYWGFIDKELIKGVAIWKI